jgi:hypothetical protein
MMNKKESQNKKTEERAKSTAMAMCDDVQYRYSSRSKRLGSTGVSVVITLS